MTTDYRAAGLGPHRIFWVTPFVPTGSMKRFGQYEGTKLSERLAESLLKDNRELSRSMANQCLGSVYLTRKRELLSKFTKAIGETAASHHSSVALDNKDCLIVDSIFLTNLPKTIVLF